MRASSDEGLAHRFSWGGHVPMPSHSNLRAFAMIALRTARSDCARNGRPQGHDRSLQHVNRRRQRFFICQLQCHEMLDLSARRALLRTQAMCKRMMLRACGLLHWAKPAESMALTTRYCRAQEAGDPARFVAAEKPSEVKSSWRTLKRRNSAERIGRGIKENRRNQERE
jgi:hypothetical protein